VSSSKSRESVSSKSIFILLAMRFPKVITGNGKKRKWVSIVFAGSKKVRDCPHQQWRKVARCQWQFLDDSRDPFAEPYRHLNYLNETATSAFGYSMTWSNFTSYLLLSQSSVSASCFQSRVRTWPWRWDPCHPAIFLTWNFSHRQIFRLPSSSTFVLLKSLTSSFRSASIKWSKEGKGQR
jgi:hypothetical protein